MTEHPADNGFGAYINGITPTVENRRPNQWAYDIPKLLSLTPEYAASKKPTSTDESKKVANPKTGVEDYIVSGLIVIFMLGIIIYKVNNKDKFKTNI
jgi:hypothetical protein